MEFSLTFAVNIVNNIYVNFPMCAALLIIKLMVVADIVAEVASGEIFATYRAIC